MTQQYQNNMEDWIERKGENTNIFLDYTSWKLRYVFSTSGYIKGSGIWYMYDIGFLLIFHCVGINCKDVRYLADPKRPFLNSLDRDLIYHLGFFINLYVNFLIFLFDWYFFVVSKAVFLLATMNFRHRSSCLHPSVSRDIPPWYNIYKTEP